MKPVFDTEEYSILCEYGAWMAALYSEDILPITKKQEKFCEDLKLKKPPTEKFARIFWIYLRRKKLFKEGKLDHQKKLIKDDREDWKKIRKMRF